MSASSRSSSRTARLLGVAACAVATLAGLGVRPATAQTKTGTTFGSFLLIEPSARVAAMGNAGVTLPDGVDAVYYNPAAIARTSRWGVHFTHAAWFADIAYNYVATSIPMGRWGNAFASVTALNSGQIDVRTVSQPLGTGERYSVSDVALGLGYGREITDRFSVGGQLTYVQETIWHSSASTTVIGLGTLYQVSDAGLRIGASLTNFGTQAAFSGRDLRIAFDADPARYGDNGTLPAAEVTGDFMVPVLFRAGLGLPVRIDGDHELRLALDLAHPSDNTESVSAGGELVYRRSVALRWGFQNAFQQDAEGGLTMGAGLQGDSGGRHYLCDYGWADHGRLGNVHRFSLTLLF
jgi:hypothetical protein